MVKRTRGLLAGVAVAALMAVASLPGIVTAASGSRTISLYNIHTKETVTVVYKKDGKYDEAALEKINHVLRDHRANAATKMDRDLIDLVWEMHQELGSKEPIHVISGYRSRASNELLRKTVGGQASESRHILGKAMDVHFPDVPVKNLRYSALVREKGGVGYYPTSALPFVHVDTDRVRSWPRLPRLELALLFPSGTTKHATADGGSITKEDVQMARARHPELATQIAEFRGGRGAAPVAVALNAPAPAPRLVDAPKQVAVAAPMAPTPAERAGLTDLFSLASAPQLVKPPTLAQRPQKPTLPSLSGGPAAPQGVIAPPVQKPAPQLAAINPAARSDAPVTDAGRFSLGAGWAAAPDFDEEHPDELSYRPFPIAPYLTETAAQPLMTELIPHDVARTVDFIDQAATQVPLRFRASGPAAQKLWSLQFKGEAIGIDKLREAQAPMPTANPIQNRAVRTSEKTP
ncbi:MAG: DUF882 domain-containing protein [Hyphomicrobiaceae bacterium]